MFRTKISFQGGMNILGDLSGSDRECLFASSADLRTGVIRPFEAPTWERQAPSDQPGSTAFFFTYRGKWYYSTAERHYVGTFNQGSEIVAWTEYGGTAQKVVNGVQAPLGTPAPIAPMIVKNSNPIFATNFEAAAIPGTGNLPAGQRFYRLSAKNAFGILPPTAEIAVSNIAAGNSNSLQWSHVNGVSGWVVFGSSISGAEVSLAELPGDITTWTDSGNVSGGSEKASDFDTPGARVYVYTYVRTVGGVTDESGPSPTSFPLDYKHGVTLTRDPTQDGYFDAPDTQSDNVLRVQQSTANAHVTSFFSMGQFDAIKFVCDGSHGLTNGDLVFFNGAGWAGDPNYENQTYTCYVPDGSPTIFFILNAPRPQATWSPSSLLDSTFTVTTSNFVVTLQGLHDPAHDPIPYDPAGSAPGDAMFLDLGTLGTQMVKVVGWDLGTQEATVVGKGISQITSSERRHPTTSTQVITPDVTNPTLNYGRFYPGFPIEDAWDENPQTYFAFEVLGVTPHVDYPFSLTLGGWQQRTATYTSHVILKMLMPNADSTPFVGGTLTIDVSIDSGGHWTNLFTGDFTAFKAVVQPFSMDLGAITDLSGIQVRFSGHAFSDNAPHNPINNDLLHTYLCVSEIWTEASASDTFAGSSGTAKWLNNNGWITNWNVYRTGDTPDFLLVDQVDPYSLSYTDTKPTLALGSAITSFYNDGTQDVIYKPPPVGMLGLINHNGSWMGIDGYSVRYSPAGAMDAYPDGYLQTFDERPMALVSHNGAAHVFLRDGVWRIDGADPSVFVFTKTAAADGCTAPNSVQIVRNKVVYLGPRGITVYDGMKSECISDRRMPIRYIIGSAGPNPSMRSFHPTWSDDGKYLPGNSPLIPAVMTRAFEDATAEYGAPIFDAGSNPPDLLDGAGPGPIWNNTAAATRLRNLRSFVYQGRYYLYWSSNATFDPSGFTDESWGCFVVDFESEDMPITFMPIRIADAIVSEDQIPYWLIRAVAAFTHGGGA